MKTSGDKSQSRLTIGRFSSMILAAVFFLALVLGSCGDSSTGSNGGNGGNGGGELQEPTFSNVLNIFSSSCGGSDCHISSPQSGVQLNNYENVMSSQGAQYGELVVQKGDADGSPLVDKIESDNPEFGVRMTEGGPYLSDDEIDLIKEWINDGAENN